MKLNLPVTQREKLYPKGRYLVSKTDLKGIITYANDAFVEPVNARLIDSNLEAARQAKAAADVMKGAAGDLRKVAGQFKVVG